MISSVFSFSFEDFASDSYSFSVLEFHDRAVERIKSFRFSNMLVISYEFFVKRRSVFGDSIVYACCPIRSVNVVFSICPIVCDDSVIFPRNVFPNGIRREIRIDRMYLRKILQCSQVVVQKHS